MNGYDGPPPGGGITRVLVLAIVAVIVLCIVVSVIKALWPWLVGIGLVAVGIAAVARLHRRNIDRW